jgi:glycosyltransferase involved in cell wall biosynthesis
MEERLIARMLRRIPAWVDAVYVVDDASTDSTPEVVRGVRDARIHLISHRTNRGVGAAIVSGYRQALVEHAEVLVVMAGDDQMDPNDLPALVAPVVGGSADYAKGNRFRHANARDMPWARSVAGRLLSLLTRAATRLPVGDSQCGYTALSARAARRLPLQRLWPRFGYPNDLLAMLAEQSLKVLDVPVRPVYADETSRVRAWHVLSIGALILHRYWRSRRAAAWRELPAHQSRQEAELPPRAP